MPTFEKLTKDDVSDILESKRRGRSKSQRQRIIDTYKTWLQALEVGEGVAVKLDDRDNRQTVKNRMKRAASELGYQIDFIRSRGMIRVHRVA